ncbi:MAG: rhomboid family intramembrane serine protease [Rhodospirillales bacterium]
MEIRRMCPHCRAFITTSDRVCPYCEGVVGPRAVERRSPKPVLGGFIPHAYFTTTMILLINFGLFAATVIYSMRAGNPDAVMSVDPRTLFDFGAKLREAIQYGQWWRLVTAGFLHGGLIHILMNSWVLFDVGAQVEQIYGSARLIVIYFAATVFGFYASAVWSAGLSVGASAGLLGLIGAMIAVGVRSRSPLGAEIRGLYTRWVIYILIIGFLPGLRIDNAAHIGGLAAGFATGYVAGSPKLVETWTDRVWRVAACLCVLITAFCFYQMYRWFSASA